MFAKVTDSRLGGNARQRRRSTLLAGLPLPLPLPLLVLSALLVSHSALAGPEIQHWMTDQGAKVLFVEAPDLPMLDIRVALDAGSARDGERPGIASLSAGLLTQGAGDWDADAIAERVESIGAQLSASTERDMTTVSLRTLTDEPALNTAIETLTTVLSTPRFETEDVERVKRNRLTALRQAEQDPGTVGRKAFYRAVFRDHPYASDPSGTAESVAQLAPEDFQRFHQDYYRASGATIAMVGAIDRARAERIAKAISAGLPKGEAPPHLPPVAGLDHGDTQTIDFPSSQTHLYAGAPGMKRGDPDYFPLYVGNHILGGSGLVSLLMEQVREKRGLSYSVYSYFLPLAQRGPFMLGLQTKNVQAEQACEVLLETLRQFIAQGPSEKELDDAVKNITGGFPLRIASNSKIVSYLAVIGFYDLPLDYLDRLTDRIRAVTREQIQDAFARRVHPDKLQIVMVGQPVAAAEEPMEDESGEQTSTPDTGANAGDI
ncbi:MULTISPECIES: M16 family metallopeptidase [Thiorhodovibrio]|uniref:M16 family metallopeptidase n=1 Tax=Thiorhodovibrio TaxID=61593 RepID=UPI00191332B5|nr:MULTISPECIES: pitrilysin family protein [Thiorhodovibrio]MBK5969626.1 peptidase M16 [Thiorhodovibrio winogradskyi]WPL14694.1 coenzyme PQQ biosynthesis protein PqqF [Thiorhodovibrio litoralis]